MTGILSQSNCSADSAQAGFCPVCGAAGYPAKRGINGYDIYKCSACQLDYAFPMPDERCLTEFYNRYSDIRADERVLCANALDNIRHLTGYGLNRESALLDYGSGKGCFTAVSSCKNWRNYDPFTLDCEKTVLQQSSFSWVTLWGVLEHLPSPTGVMAELAGFLIPGGYLAGTTVSSELAIPFQYKPPEHVTYWTKSAINHLFQLENLELLEYRQYHMKQLSEVYMSIILRTVPNEYKEHISYDLPKFVEVPTNEVFFVAKKRG